MAPRPVQTTDIRITASMKVKPEAVFRALTSARELCVWWLDRAETEARNSGRFRMVWPPNRKLNGGEVRGTFVDLQKGEKVAWLWSEEAAGRGTPPLISFFIEKKGRGCDVTLLHSGFSAAKSRERAVRKFRESWEDCLAKLKLYLEQGKTCKEDPLTFAEVEMLRKASRR